MASIIFLFSLGLWTLAKFRTVALFIAAGLMGVLVILVLLCFGAGTGYGFLGKGVAWGALVEAPFVLSHTALPVLCAAFVCFALRRRGAKYPR